MDHHVESGIGGGGLSARRESRHKTSSTNRGLNLSLWSLFSLDKEMPLLYFVCVYGFLFYNYSYLSRQLSAYLGEPAVRDQT